MKMSGLPNILPPAPFIGCALPWSRPNVVKNIFEHQYFSMAEKASRENILQWVFLAKKASSPPRQSFSFSIYLSPALPVCPAWSLTSDEFRSIR